MKLSSVKWFGYLFSFVFLIISCAGTETELTQNQVNEAYNLHFAHGEIKFQDLYHLSSIIRLTCLYHYK